jgi:hypothetical protein
MDELNEIERALRATSEHAHPMALQWFEEHWKPKFDKIRSLLMTPELKECEPDQIRPS